MSKIVIESNTIHINQEEKACDKIAHEILHRHTGRKTEHRETCHSLFDGATLALTSHQARYVDSHGAQDRHETKYDGCVHNTLEGLRKGCGCVISLIPSERSGERSHPDRQTCE